MIANLKIERSVGYLLLIGSIGVLLPYLALTVYFDYPMILRKDTGYVLTKFNDDGGFFIFIWWLFAMLGLPLVVAYGLLGNAFTTLTRHAAWITTVGIFGLLAQFVGLLRWVFVVPYLAHKYEVGLKTGDISAQEISKTGFELVNQFGGVLLGESVGQLFTIIWLFGMCWIFWKHKLAHPLFSVTGLVVGILYLLAQAELFNTVIPTFPFWDLAGLLGSSLWIVWMMVLGMLLLDKPKP